MRKPIHPTPYGAQTGGITILVVFMLLVLVTISAMAMAKNSLREVISSGVSRQGAMARNNADSGIEWTAYWLNVENVPSATGTALKINALKALLKATPSMYGLPYDPITQSVYTIGSPPAVPTDLTVAAGGGTVQGFTLALTAMGKLPITNFSQGVGASAYTPAYTTSSNQAPDLWALRSDSQVTVGTGALATTFYHSKEAWISTVN